MKTLRIIGVPEHFNYPFRLLEERQPFLDRGIQIKWIDESRGSGQMNLALRNDEADLAILLTESFLRDFEAGNPSKMIGYHVKTPLIWGIHIRAGSQINRLDELAKKHFLVSRMGSGSHLMAMVLARREKWKKAELTFEPVGNMDGAREVMKLGNDGMFLWEKYTTAPEVKNGTMVRLDEVASPWPCFVMAASDRALLEFGQVIFDVRDEVFGISNSFSRQSDQVQILSEFYQLDPEDVEKWLTQTSWCTDTKISISELNGIMQEMKELGILQEVLDPKRFLAVSGLDL